jgi:hypothetical protein
MPPNNPSPSDLVQAFLKKWWVESDFKVPNLKGLLSSTMKEIELVSTENIKSYKVTFYNKDGTVTTKTVRTIRRCCFVGVIN